jgi:hypothetical protein
VCHFVARFRTLHLADLYSAKFKTMCARGMMGMILPPAISRVTYLSVICFSVWCLDSGYCRGMVAERCHIEEVGEIACDSAISPEARQAR